MIIEKTIEPQYTPGPYFYVYTSNGVDDVWAIKSKHGKHSWIASIDFWDDGDGIEAARYEPDARLLAAAPELLDALTAMLNVTSQVPVQYRDKAFCDAVLDARRVLAKALGPLFALPGSLILAG